MTFRGTVPDFQLANPLYAGATVTFYTVEDGEQTTTLATLYAAPSGGVTVNNPQILDSEGKLNAAVYIEVPVIAEVTGGTVGTHSTGIIGLSPDTGSVNTEPGGAAEDSVATFADPSGFLLRNSGLKVTRGGVASGWLARYPTMADFLADDLPDDVTYVRFAGYYTPGDGGESTWVVRADEPDDHEAFRTSNNGKIIELAEMVPTPQMVGAKADGAWTLEGFKTIKGDWATATDFVAGDLVFHTTDIYRGFRCTVDHTSGTFATDLAAGKWVAGSFSGTDNIAAMQVINDFGGVKRRMVRVPAGDYRFGPYTTSNGTFIKFNYDFHFLKGDPGARFFVDDGEANSIGYLDFISITNKIMGVTTPSTNLDDHERCRFQGIKFCGSWLNAPAYSGADFTAIANFARLEYVDCDFENCRGKVNRNHFCKSALWDNCTLVRGASGGIGVTNSQKQLFNNIFISELDDDVIWPGNGQVVGGLLAICEQVVISNIIAEKCQNIIVGPTRQLSISSVNGRLMKGVTLSPFNGTGSGDYSPYNTSVSGINLRDCINGPDLTGASIGTPPTALLTSGIAAMSVYGAQPQGGSTAAIPEFFDSTGKTVISPRQLDNNGAIIFQNTADGGSYSSNPGYNTHITGFNILRTLPTGGNYSAFGYGLCFSKYGYFDPSVGDAEFAKYGISFNARSRNVALVGGNIMGFPAGAGVYFNSTATGSMRDMEFDQVVLANINMRDVQYGVATSRAGTAATNTWRIAGYGLNINCDPDCKSSARTIGGSGPDGTWQNAIAAASRPIALYVDRVQGWTFRDCIIANCYDAVYSANPSDFRAGGSYSNIELHCDPAAAGFSTSNKGIGTVLPAGDAFKYKIFDCDPTSATFRDLKNVCIEEASAIPASGTYVENHFIRNTSPTVTAGQVLDGWRRASGRTGTGAVDGTDWIRKYSDTSARGAPATVNTDADFTLTVGTSSVDQLHTGTLTANRTITLATSGAYPGARFRVSRTGSGAFNLSVGGLVSLGQNAWCEVVYNGSAWVLEEFGYLTATTSQPTSTVNSDADFTLTVGTSSPYQKHTGTLTANRSVTLSTSGAYAGAFFVIRRTGTGNFKLNVGTGPLAAMPPNSWARFVYDGSAWYLLEYADLGLGTETIASATTTDLGTLSSKAVFISGTTTITSFGSSASIGTEKTIEFLGALTLTHNATSLICPTGASISTAAGDVATVRHEGSGNWRVLHYTRATGKALTPSAFSDITGKPTTLSGYGITDAEPLGKFSAKEDQSGDYTLALSDLGKFQRCTKGTAQALTVPPNSSVPFDIGTSFLCSQSGAGQVTVTPGAGVTLNSPGGALKSRVQYSQFTITKVDTDTWLVGGDLTP